MIKTNYCLITAFLGASLLLSGVSVATNDKTAEFDVASYTVNIESWRKEKEESLRSEYGWLSVVGLQWLKEGANPFWTKNDGKLEFFSSKNSPTGVFHFNKGEVSLEILDSKADFSVNGTKLEIGKRHDIKSDKDGAEKKPDEIVVGKLKIAVIQRSEKMGLRMRDPSSPARSEFKGRVWYPVDPAQRVVADFEPAKSEQKLKSKNILGQDLIQELTGVLRFNLNGKSYSLSATGNPQEGVFIVFKDLTNGKVSYGAGRFLTTEPVANGKVVVDFNKAYSPPCAFTPYATCPLAPPGNHLKVEIAAGEKYSKSKQLHD